MSTAQCIVGHPSKNIRANFGDPSETGTLEMPWPYLFPSIYWPIWNSLSASVFPDFYIFQSFRITKTFDFDTFPDCPPSIFLR